MRYDRETRTLPSRHPRTRHMTSSARYIRYVFFDGEETILEGCDGKQTPFTARRCTRVVRRPARIYERQIDKDDHSMCSIPKPLERARGPTHPRH